MNAAVGSRNGVATEKIDVLADYAKSPLFSDAEKVALEYADAMVGFRKFAPVPFRTRTPY